MRWIACCVLLLATACQPRGVGDNPVSLYYEVDVDHRFDPGEAPAAVVERTVAVMRKRLASLEVPGTIDVRGTRLDVKLRRDAAGLESAKSLLGRPGRLALDPIDEDGDYMKAVATRVSDDTSHALGIATVERDEWRGYKDNAPHTDSYLAAADDKTLREVFARTGVALPTDRRLVYDHQVSPDRWRSYCVVDKPIISNEHVAEASVEVAKESGIPGVKLALTPAGTRLFAEATKRLVGHKIALLVDDTVISVPMIAEAITTGRVYLTFGHITDPEVALKEARRVTTALASGAFAAPVLVLQQR